MRKVTIEKDKKSIEKNGKYDQKMQNKLSRSMRKYRNQDQKVYGTDNLLGTNKRFGTNENIFFQKSSLITHHSDTHNTRIEGNGSNGRNGSNGNNAPTETDIEQIIG